MNRERQDADRKTLAEALELLARSFDPERDYGVVLASEGWHPGVVGIVASRVVERIHRPAILIALDGKRGRGSARSIPDYDLLEGIRACGSHLERFGGHRQAAGMEIRKDRIPEFREAFDAEARRNLEGRSYGPPSMWSWMSNWRRCPRISIGISSTWGPMGSGIPVPPSWPEGSPYPAPRRSSARITSS